MPELIDAPMIVPAAGNQPKVIREYVGAAHTQETRVSVAHISSPSGWVEPGQRPDFDEFTLVLDGALVVEHEGGTIEVRSGQAVHCRRGEWVRYSTPGPTGADYVSVCLPAFTPSSVHRDS